MGIFAVIAEGGQTWTHRMRMLKQVVKFTLGTSFMIGLAVFCLLMGSLDKVNFQGTWYYIKAKTAGSVLEKLEVDKKYWAKTSHEIYHTTNPMITPSKLEKNSYPYFLRVTKESGKNLYQATLATTLTMTGFLLFFLVKGARSRKKKHISGKKIVPPWLLRMQLKLTRQASPISIGGLPLAKGTETQHILITGGTGSGKTNCIHHLLSQIKNGHSKGLIVDTSGIFVDKYFDEKRDILLNPFDKRGSPWHPWAECQTKADYEEISECFIPRSFNENENYWRTAAKALLCAVLRKTEYSKRISDVQDWILLRPLTELAQFLEGTKAAAHIDLRADKTAGSIRSVASSYLSCLEYLENTENPFSISNWMKNEKEGWLFLVAKPSQRSALGPLLSCWISLAFRTLIQLEPSLDRRTWFILDELPSLNKIRDLESFLAEGRKYGGAGLLALQSPSQLDSIYGSDVTKTIIGNCATKITFSEQDPIVAELISKSFGDREILEYQESISFGANSVRDGVSLTENKKRQHLVSASEIQSLKKNQAFVKLPGSLPVTKLKLEIFR